MAAEADRFERVLVATDFSSNAGVALNRAIEIAAAHNARIELIHAVDATTIDTLPLELRDEVSKSLGALEQVVARSGVEVSSGWRAGRPWEVIAAAERDLGADLVVIGARGQTPYAHLFLGSTADRVLRTAAAPVVTVHAGDTPTGSATPTVLVATDFSEEAALATSAAVRFLNGMGAGGRLVLLYAWQPLVEYEYVRSGGTLLNRLDDTEERARTAIEGLAAPLESEGRTVETIARQGYPATVIGREAMEIGADLIAVGTHGRSGLKRLLLGSIAERVVHHAPCPVLTVRHPESTAPARLSSVAAAAP